MSARIAHVLKDKPRTKDVEIEEKADFSSLLLSKKVLYGIRKAGFKIPSPIQLKAIPIGRFGQDMVIRAKSGTGKTLVFAIVALEMLIADNKVPQILILAPTREIAFQICNVIKSVGVGFEELNCETFIGGIDLNSDKEFAATCQIVVGTPGRIKQLIHLKILRTKAIRLFILDEADALLSGSFKEEIDDIFRLLPSDDMQVIAASATYPKNLAKVVRRYFRDPFFAETKHCEVALLGVVHYFYKYPDSRLVVKNDRTKRHILSNILNTVNFNQCVVFCNQITKVDILKEDIEELGFTTMCISSDLSQMQRLKVVESLKRFKCKVLVSSDITARGIDAENVNLILHFDLPYDLETYLHRVGRAGRYGSRGASIIIVNEVEEIKFVDYGKQARFKTYLIQDPVNPDLISLQPQVVYDEDSSNESSSESDYLSENDVVVKESKNPKASSENNNFKSPIEKSFSKKKNSQDKKLQTQNCPISNDYLEYTQYCHKIKVLEKASKSPTDSKESMHEETKETLVSEEESKTNVSYNPVKIAISKNLKISPNNVKTITSKDIEALRKSSSDFFCQVFNNYKKVSLPNSEDKPQSLNSIFQENSKNGEEVSDECDNIVKPSTENSELSSPINLNKNQSTHHSKSESTPLPTKPSTSKSDLCYFHEISSDSSNEHFSYSSESVLDGKNPKTSRNVFAGSRSKNIKKCSNGTQLTVVDSDAYCISNYSSESSDNHFNRFLKNSNGGNRRKPSGSTKRSVLKSNSGRGRTKSSNFRDRNNQYDNLKMRCSERKGEVNAHDSTLQSVIIPKHFDCPCFVKNRYKYVQDSKKANFSKSRGKYPLPSFFPGSVLSQNKPFSSLQHGSVVCSKGNAHCRNCMGWYNLFLRQYEHIKSFPGCFLNY